MHEQTVRAATASLLILIAWSLFIGSCHADESVSLQKGYVVGNFGISAQIAEGHGLDTLIQVNPPELGEFLREFAHGTLWVEAEGSAPRRVPLRPVEISRTFPEYIGKFAAAGVSAEIRIFAPLGLKARNGFLPALILQTTWKAKTGWKGTVGYTLVPKEPQPAPAQRLRSGELAGIIRGSAFLGLAGPTTRQARVWDTAHELVASTRLEVEAGAAQELTFIVGTFSPRGYYANEFKTARDLLTSLAMERAHLAADLEAFIAALPATGDATIDRYLRWYLSAGILLTKGLRTGEVLTMGYRELNQRDSFWATGLHMVFWPELDRAMLRETMAAQKPNGQIPTTILPLIDREDDIDITAYFILRASRYYRWHRDRDWLTQTWPAIKKAVAYLASRDVDRVGVPKQSSYWADWKDVPGVQGRTYAPHFALLWVAALAAASELAVTMHDALAANDYTQLKARAAAFINRSFDQGGMWSGRYYVDRWADGRLSAYALEDQTVGAYFDVIPSDRLESIYQQLKANETPNGVRETYPYAPYPSGYEAPYDKSGNYHNGGIWPYLNFVDAAGRYRHGSAADAERIIRNVGHADLEAHGDYAPHEFLNGETGQNLGFSIISWDAALFSTIYFGAFGIDRVSDSTIQMHVRTPRARDFSTRLMLPGTSGILSSRAGHLTWRADSPREPAASELTVEVLDERADTPMAGSARGLDGTAPRARPEESGFSAQRLNYIDEFYGDKVRKGELAGIVTLIARHGKIVHLSAVGYADVETKQKMETGTIFRLYSMTKPIASTALMMLYEEGRFQMDDPVSRYIPELATLRVLRQPDAPLVDTVALERPPTVQDLMRHTAGFVHGGEENAVGREYVKAGVLGLDVSLAEMMTKLARIPLAYQPNTRFVYSVAPDVQARLVEILSGMPFDQFLQKRLFTPLGMKDTAFWLDTDEARRLTRVHWDKNGRLTPLDEEHGYPAGDVLAEPWSVNSYTVNHKRKGGSFGLVGTAEDYWRFAQMMLNGGELSGTRLLSPQTVRYMTRDHLASALEVVNGRQTGVGWGAGFAIVKDPAAVGFMSSEGTFFWAGAAGTQFWVDPKEDLVVVALIQHMGTPAVSAFMPQVRALVYSAMVK